MATAKRNDEGVTLNLTNDEAKNLTMVLAHVSTASTYDTFDVLEALTETENGDGIADLVRLFSERALIKVGIVSGHDDPVWFDPHSILLLVRE